MSQQTLTSSSRQSTVFQGKLEQEVSKPQSASSLLFVALIGLKRGVGEKILWSVENKRFIPLLKSKADSMLKLPPNPLALPPQGCFSKFLNIFYRR